MLELGDLIKPAQEVLSPIGGTLGETWQALFGDRVAAWRLKNAIETQKRLHDELRKAGLALNTSKIPERYAFAWFEEATKQDEPEIQALFARLLARAAAGEEDAADRRHLGTVGQMCPMDARIFLQMFDAATSKSDELPEWDYSDLEQLFEPDALAGFRSLEVLITLGLAIETTTLEPIGAGGVSIDGSINHYLARRLSSTLSGLSLYRAVRQAPPPAKPTA